jgi:hypothetical protein
MFAHSTIASFTIIAHCHRNLPIKFVVDQRMKPVAVIVFFMVLRRKRFEDMEIKRDCLKPQYGSKGLV